MPACKCRFCQSRLMTDNAYKVEKNKKKAYFCNEEHYNEYAKIEETRKQEEKEAIRLAEQKRVKRELEEQEAKEKRKADKDRVYWLICDIIGRKEIINTFLWKEWEIWKKVATNEVIGDYLEENKAYLMDAVSKLDNIEGWRIKYLSAIIKNNIGDYKPNKLKVVKPQIEETNTEIETRDDVGLRVNKKKKTERRQGFAEMGT